MKKILIALLVLLMALALVACSSDPEEEEDPSHVHTMEQCGAVYHCTECDKYYEDEAGTVKLTKISTLEELRTLCETGGKAVLVGDIEGSSTVDSGAYSGKQTAAVNVKANVTIYDDGTARSFKRVDATTVEKAQFFEICGGGTLNLIASSAGKIVIDGDGAGENGKVAEGNTYMVRVNGNGAANFVNVAITNVKNKGTGAAIRLDHSVDNVVLTMTNCTVSGCSTTGNGGVFSATDGTSKKQTGNTTSIVTATFTNCTFTGNQCDKYGAVYYATQGNDHITFNGCTFTDNTTPSNTSTGANAILCQASGYVGYLTLVGTNKIGETSYEAAAETALDGVKAAAKVYWPST